MMMIVIIKIVICNTIIHLLVNNFLKRLWPGLRARVCVCVCMCVCVCVCKRQREREKKRTVKFYKL